MPDISLLEPQVLQGVVEKFPPGEGLILLNRLDRTPWPYPSATWDVIRGSRALARPNVPNSEAHVVPRLGRSQESAAFVYLREKKVFEPTTIHWIRTPGTIAARNAEEAVMREVGDLNTRFDAFVEFMCWQAMQGELVLDFPDVQATVDYKFPASHTPTSAALWDGSGATQPTATSIVNDVRAWKRLISRDGRVPAREAFATENTINTVVEAFIQDANAAALMSDRMRDEYYSSGILPGFLGLNWVTTESVYEDANGNQTLFLPQGKVVICNLDDQRPMEIMDGPSADDAAPDGHTGKFSKSWRESDPSARQYLLEQNALPVVKRVEQFVSATVGAISTSI